MTTEQSQQPVMWGTESTLKVLKEYILFSGLGNDKFKYYETFVSRG